MSNYRFYRCRVMPKEDTVPVANESMAPVYPVLNSVEEAVPTSSTDVVPTENVDMSEGQLDTGLQPEFVPEFYVDESQSESSVEMSRAGDASEAQSVIDSHNNDNLTEEN